MSYTTSTSDTILDDDGLKALLQRTVVGVTGLAPSLVRPRWQPQPPTQPSPTTNWCAIGVTTYTPSDYSQWTQDTDTSGTQHRLEQVDMLATFYGPKSGWYASRFRDGLYFDQNYRALRRAGLHLRSVDDIVHLGEEVAAQMIQRSDVPASFMRFVERTYDQPAVGQVTVNFDTDAGLNCTITAG